MHFTVLNIALAQINPTVGDVEGNIGCLRAARGEAAGADLVICGEMASAGYPPEDLVLKPVFQERIERAVTSFAGETGDGGPAVLLGSPWRLEGKLYNAALLLEGGHIAALRLKHRLPNYGVFDEKRLFSAGPNPEPVDFRGCRLGGMVCEDMWTPAVSRHLKERGAEVLLVLNGSPFEVDKMDARRDMAKARAAESGLSVVYVNLIGGQDELVFDGASFVVDPGGAVLVQAASWKTQVVDTLWRKGAGGWACAQGPLAETPERLESIYRALVTGLDDYVAKNGFPGVVIGLSGGVDSALTAAVAVDALGAERVMTVMMPSPHTSTESLDDAAEVARLLGVGLKTVSIEPAMKAFAGMLEEAFAGRQADVAEENIQARSRALVLMALSNKLGHMVLTTGNKSEMSVGFATLYGDMCGGYSVLKDVYKTEVFALARWRNAHQPEDGRGPVGPVMPENVIAKPPSAELRPNQTDQDTLPDYAVLDAILECLVEEERSAAEAVAQGFDADTVRMVWRMLDRAEYKRRQAPPGVKITSRAFGRDRRYPITNRLTDMDI